MRTYKGDKVSRLEWVQVDRTCSVLVDSLWLGRITSADNLGPAGRDVRDSQHQRDEGLPGRAGGARCGPGGLGTPSKPDSIRGERLHTVARSPGDNPTSGFLSYESSSETV